MRRNDWLIAAAVVLALLAALLYEPRGGPAADGDARDGAAAGIVELPVVEAPAVATVELESSERGAAATELTTRFEREHADAAWAATARAALDRSLARVYADYDARLADAECRRTACRVTLEVADAARRPAAVADALAALQRDGHETLLEHADGRRASLVIGVRTPRTP